MRIVVAITLLIVSMSYYAKAQQWLQLGLGGGASHSHISGTVDFYQASPIFGFNGTVKAMGDFRKVRAGLALEAGNIAGKVVKQHISTRSDDARKTLAENNSIAGGYKLPHAFVHGKINLKGGNYIFAGGMAGWIMGNSQVAERSFSSFAFGINAGVVFQLTGRLGLELTEGWRHTQISGNVYPGKNMQHRLDYFNTNVGVVYSFGK